MISLDIGLRRVGLLALTLWDIVIDVLERPVKQEETLRVNSKTNTTLIHTGIH